MNHKTAEEHGRLSLNIEDELGRDIGDGLIRPGERLNEAALAERFGTSRGPIREDLRHIFRNPAI